jgi:hypothetical protein
MVGQISNFMKTFGKAVNDAGPILKNIAGAIGSGYTIYDNLSKLDDPNINARDATNSVIKAALAPIELIPRVGLLATAVSGVVDAAAYFQDVTEGKKDAPPMPAEINSRMNPIGTISNKIIKSAPFVHFFSRW